MNIEKKAILWITNILNKHAIPFQIAGGLAVRAYGSSRKLMDIDIDIPEEDFETLKLETAPYIIFGPSQFKNEHWDLLLMTLNYHGQEIDLAGAYHTKIYNSENNAWKKIITDFSKTNYMTIHGLSLPVISREELIAYKKILARPIDLVDVKFLEES